MTVKAPFRFARINRWVWFPEWQDLVTHDVPFKDGISGEVTFTLTAKTPLLVGGARKKPTSDGPGAVLPFQLPNGRYAIPGSALQGMVRSILEIAAFGKLGPVIDDKRFGLRDLNENAQPFYQARLNSIAYGSRPLKITPKIEVGWLRRDGEHYELLKCKLARIEFGDLSAITSVPDANIVLGAKPAGPYAAKLAWERAHAAIRSWRKKSDVAERYGWCAVANLAPSLTVGPTNDYTHANGSVSIKYSKVSGSSPGATKGHIVLTGNTRDNAGAGSRHKHMEFFFHTPGSVVTSLPESFDTTFKEFLALHAPDDGRKQNPNWEFFRDRGYPDPAKGGPFKDGGWMPIFYLPDADKVIDTFGLAYMFKMAHQNTTHQTLRNSAKEHVPDPLNARDPAHRLDLASLIFGEKAGTEKEGPEKIGKATDHGLKRRAVFDLSLALLPAGAAAQTATNPTVLLSPKPSYHPIYVRQTGQDDVLGTYVKPNGQPASKPYATYTPLDASKFQPEKELEEAHRDPELAGHKIWPALRGDQCIFPSLSRLPDQIANSTKVQLNLTALPRETRFPVTLRFHNLRRVELGAILWALTFGETAPELISARRHRLGMGKPLHLGALSINGVALKGTCNNGGAMPTVTDCVGAFTELMTTAYADSGDAQGWRSSTQIAALRMAWDPAQNVVDDFQYMRLDNIVDSYVENKKSNRFLPDYAAGGEPNRSPPPRPGAGGSPRPAQANTLTAGCRVQMVVGGSTGVVVGPSADPRRPWKIRFDGTDRVRDFAENNFVILHD